MDDLLTQIRQRHHSDRPEAERLLLGFVRETFPLDVATVELLPVAAASDWSCGFLTLADGRRLFLRTSADPDTVIAEFHHATMLAKAGYPMIVPLYSSIEAGRQLLIYEIVKDPFVADVARRIEAGDDAPLDALTDARREADRRLLEIYLETLERQSPTESAIAPIHRLFYHRLTGRAMHDSYGRETTFVLPNGEYATDSLRGRTWTVNDQRYFDSLDDVVDRAVRLLTPARAGVSVVGHGNAHGGNAHFQAREHRLVYVDPTFAGRHDPLLDLAGPLFHDTFATWLRSPDVAREELRVDVRLIDGSIRVRHDHALSPVRRMFFTSRVTHTLTPLVATLRARGWLDPQWRDRLKAALFCGPLLTRNLADRATFPAEIGVLGLAYAMEMGAESEGERSLLDQTLDDIEAVTR